MIALARDETALALADTGRAVELARSARDPQALFPSLARRAVVLFEVGETDEARASVEELFAYVDAGETFAYAPHAHWVVALAALAGQTRVLESLRPMAPSPWKEAAIASAVGDYAAAAEIFDSRDVVESAAFMHLRAAERLIGTGERAEADVHLRKALAFYRSVGAMRYIQEAEAFLRESA
jgi:tetratricopeptide (TPR) repeat protein